MATLAQIQATAAAKRAANQPLSQTLKTPASPTISFTAPLPSQNTGGPVGGPAYFNPNTPGVAYTSFEASKNQSTTPGDILAKKTTPAPMSSSIKSPSNNINGVKRTYVSKVPTSSFRDAIKTSRSRKEYEDTINFAGLDDQSKKIADRFYSDAEKKGILLPPKDLYEKREDVITQEKKDEQAMLTEQQKKMKEAEDAAKAAEEAAIEEQQAAEESNRDTFIAEQETLAKETESNRLNQVRGNIMQVLAARGVDISKLSPEQIVALSGEQGAKAFMDITDIREKTKANIKQARDTALARINDLRNRKAISKSTYERNIANINSQAEAASLNADRTASANIFALTQTKTEQGRTDATQRANAVTNIASMLGLSGSQIAPVLNLINTSGTGPEQLVAVAKMISDANSPLRKSLDANMTAAQQAALQKQLLESYKAETARISATRPRSSGGGSGDLGDALKEAFGQAN